MTADRKFEPPARRADYPSACAVCGGSVAERTVTLSVPGPDGETRLVHHVPAGVCETCGEQYLTSLIAERLERLLDEPPSEEQAVPVWDFAATA
ncbi:MAG: type II toxin-antitoxin system MqsA family antitoxin [Actinomycetota bacterium]